MPLTQGFHTRQDLEEHYQKHGTDFGAATAEDYERLADDFLGGKLCDTCYECERRSGGIVRYDWGITQRFGILSPTGHILTFFKPRSRPGHRGRRIRTVEEYYQEKCRE